MALAALERALEADLPHVVVLHRPPLQATALPPDLPEKLRAVVVLCVFSEMSYQQVSETLGIPPGTVASRKNAALARLRAELGPQFVEPS